MRRATLFFLFLFLSLGGLSACGGEASKNVNFTPPAKAGGRLCAVQCGESRNRCREACSLTQRSCTNAMQAQAIRDYESYVQDQFAAHEKVELRPSDFERPKSCIPSSCNEACDKTYQACYENCGGKVETETSCRFLCF